MRWLKMFFAALLIAVPAALFAADAPDASACSCAMIPSLAQAAERADAVFAGKVTKIEEPFAARVIRSSADPIYVSFEVERVWKGNVGADAVISTAQESASCGYPYFDSGKSFLVFAYEEEGELKTGLCSGTGPADDMQKIVDELGEGSVIAAAGGGPGGSAAGGGDSGGSGGGAGGSGSKPIGADAAVAAGGETSNGFGAFPPAVSATLGAAAVLLLLLGAWSLKRNRK